MTLDISVQATYDDAVAGRRAKSGLGGARPGAGRKRIVQDPVRLTFDLEARDFTALKAFADREAISIAEALRRAVRGHLRRLRRGSR